MWNMISGNRLLDRKRKEEAQRKHIIALNNVKSKINNSAPKEYGFLYSRPKARQLKFQRQMDIRTNNDILLERMMRSSSEMNPRHEDLGMKTLNSLYRTRVERQIDEGNQKLVRRLQGARSAYRKVRESEREYIKYKSNMAQSRMDPYYDLEYQTHAATVPHKQTRPFSAKD